MMMGAHASEMTDVGRLDNPLILIKEVDP